MLSKFVWIFWSTSAKKLFQFCNKVDHSNENGNWNWMEVGSAVVGVTIDVTGIKIYFRYIMELLLYDGCVLLTI